MAEQSRQGQFLQADFFDNTGGVNLTDSPFRMLDSQATGGYNYEYALTGGIRKRSGHTKLNSSADAQLKTLGADLHITASGTKTAIRAAGTKIQSYNLTTTFTNLTEDTVSAGSTFLDSASTQPFVTQFFKTTASDVLWGAGAGAAAGKIFGVYSATKVTQNGASPAAGAIGVTAGGVGGTIPTGTYFYAVTLRKASTVVESNAALDISVAVTLGQNVTIDLTTITAFDTTKYDKILIYRSSAGGVTGFTAGTLVSTQNSTATSYVDTGAVEDSSITVPRADSTILDNSILPSGKTYTTLASWKRRLVTAATGSVYYSDVNKPESWPTANIITIPSGGPITGLVTLSFTTPTSLDLDEILIIFKEREMWAITSSINPSTGDESFKLTMVDAVGCANQPTVVVANGFITWFDYRGFYMWDGSGKPIYCSRMLESLFQIDGDIDKTKLTYAWGKFFRKNNQVIWCLSHKVYGENKYFIKMDLRLTVPNIEAQLGGRVIDGVFIQDQTDFSLYSGATFLPSDYDELFLSGDGSGYMYSLFAGQNDADAGVDFSYETKFLDLGAKSTTKRVHKVIVWTKDSTDANLDLDWWVAYKSDEDSKATLSRPASNSVVESLWDLGYWDLAYWDSTVAAFNPVVYNLSTPIGGIEGDCIKLRFRQDDTNAPITIAGFTIIYTMLGLRK